MGRPLLPAKSYYVKYPVYEHRRISLKSLWGLKFDIVGAKYRALELGKVDILSSESAIGHLGRDDRSSLGWLGKVRNIKEIFFSTIGYILCHKKGSARCTVDGFYTPVHPKGNYIRESDVL